MKGRLRPFRSVSLRLSTGDETVVAPALKRLSSQFEGSVGIGSYPVCSQQTRSLSSPVQAPALQQAFTLHPPHYSRAGVASSEMLESSLATHVLLYAATPTSWQAHSVKTGSGRAQVEGRQDGTGIILSLESKSSGQLEAARAALITDLPEGTILGEQRNSATL